MNDLMYKCRYCDSVSSSPMNCAHCGGPSPKQIEPLIVERVKQEFVYIPRLDSTPYYRPNYRLNPIKRTYSKLGYRLATLVFVSVAVFLIVAAVYVFTYRSPFKFNGVYSIPAADPTATPVVDTNPWKDELWLPSDEVRNLREKPNVINLAYLDVGNALYSTEHSFVFTESEPWKKSDVLGISELTVNGTSVELKAYGYKYTLNAYQPFVLSQQSDKVFMINTNRAVWSANYTELDKVSYIDAVSELPIVVEPNPNLSFTH